MIGQCDKCNHQATNKQLCKHIGQSLEEWERLGRGDIQLSLQNEWQAPRRR